MKVNRDIRIQKYASENILANTQNLLQTLEKIRSRHEIEDIHDLRVASRRIRTALTIFNNFFPKRRVKNWENTIRSITRKFGKTRDLDVQIEFLEGLLATIADKHLRAGILRVHLRLVQKRKKKDRAVGKHSDDLLKDQDILAMQSAMQEIIQNNGEDGYSPALYQLAFHTIYTALDQFLYYEVFIHHPENIHELHLMRIAAKRLRYTLEIFLPLYDGKMDQFLNIMKIIQQKLGLIHDCDVWIAFIPAFMESEKQRTMLYYGRTSAMNRLLPGFIFIQQNRQAERERIYADFMQDWQKWRTEEVWLKLRELILQATISNTDTPKNNALPPQG
ncbi:MAG: CHAD domain-containing protein [Anaerolineaceae bacterium]|jgi:CHAD domain-containing protein|nr:MAG: CHAD domain-containing protein [Anaerolineaceae bacterium]